MNTNPLSRKRLVSSTLLVTTALCATVPFNMGGCADVGASIGNMTGNQQVAGLLSAGGTAVDAKNLNEGNERDMGESVAMKIAASHPIVADSQLNQYVTLVGLTLVSVSPKPDGNWYFAVIDDPAPNAISGPDGYIFVTRGALRQIQDEAELAGVLAHEITHVLDHDGLNAAKNAGYGAALAKAGSAAMSKDQRLSAFSDLTNGTVDVVVVKGYNRDQESKADAGAVKLLTAAGYDPRGYVRFLERLAADQKGGANTGGAFKTHPGAAERAKAVEQAIATAGNPQGATLADRYNSMTKGK